MNHKYKNLNKEEIESVISSYFYYKQTSDRKVKLYCLNKAAYDLFNNTLKKEFEALQNHLKITNDNKRRKIKISTRIN